MYIMKYLIVVLTCFTFSLPAMAQEEFSIPEGDYEIVEMVPISTRAIICRSALDHRNVGAVAGVVSSGAGYLAYRMWRSGGRTLVRKTLKRAGAVVTRALSIAGVTFSANEIAQSMALMDLCTADFQELVRLAELSPAALATEESLTMRTLIGNYGVHTIQSLIRDMLMGDEAAMREGLLNYTPSGRSQEEILEEMENHPPGDFEIPAEARGVEA